MKDEGLNNKIETDRGKHQKSEALETLVAGIAHEFNNILTAVIGNIVLAKMYTKPGSEVSDILSEAEKASLRAENLSRQLLTLFRGGGLLKKIISIRELIIELAGLVSYDSSVSCEFSLPDNLWPVEVDEGQIRQAVNNFFINARESMPEGGVIKVRAENITAGPVQLLSMDEGGYVRLSIEDHGAGISEAHAERIFDPFFASGQKGSGLGIKSAFTIIKNHNGYITVESGAGCGTTFHVYLPAARGKIPGPQAEERTSLSGRRRVLVMDDEEIVRNVVDRMLTQCGCEASFASDGNEMIDLYKKAMESDRPFDAVIIDLVISRGMGGKEAIRRLLEIDPGAKAIVSSGYVDDLSKTDFKKIGFKDILAKPYNISELNHVLHEVIVGKPG